MRIRPASPGKPRRSPLIVLSLSLVLGACGDGTSGDDGPGPGSPGGSVADSLSALGVPMDKSPRRGPTDEPLPDDYAPLGTKASLDARDDTASTDPAAPIGTRELFLLGIERPSSTSLVTWLELDPFDITNTRFADDVMHVKARGSTPWAESSGADPATLREASLGDFNGDGLDEIAVVYRLPGSPSIRLQVYSEKRQQFGALQSIDLGDHDLRSLSVQAGDFDGDGFDELAVGMAYPDSADIMVVDNTDGVLSFGGQTIGTFRQFVPGSDVSLRLAAGNADFDAPFELTVVVNERFERGGEDSAQTRYYLLDDGKRRFGEVSRGLVQGVGNRVTRTAIVADVDMGDVDGDGFDELVFGGLQGFDPQGRCDYRYIVLVLDDIPRDTALLSSAEQDADFAGSSCAPEAVAGELRFVHVNALDVDGDNVDEIQANQFVFDQVPGTGGPGFGVTTLPLLHTLDAEVLFKRRDSDDGVRFDHDTTTIVVGDFTNDGREDVAVYSRDVARLSIWGVSNSGAAAPLGPGWRELHEVDTTPVAADASVRPLLLAPDVDSDDSTVVRVSAGSHRTVYTEPVVIAVLAGAPCFTDLGQPSCVTSFGTETVGGGRSEFSTSVSAGIAVTLSSGFELFGSGGTAKLKAAVQGSIGRDWATSYSVSRSVTYNTAPVSDEVVFTSIAYDVYTYEVLSHPDSMLVGESIDVALPRDIRTYKVPVDVYESNLVEGGPRIRGNVLTHTAGDPRTYRTRSQKDTVVRNVEGSVLGRILGPVRIEDRILDLIRDVGQEILYDDLAALDIRLESVAAQAVNAGGGSVEQSISFSTSTDDTISARVDGSLSLTVDAALFGNGTEIEVTVGLGVGASFTVFHGDGTTYAGAVGDIPPENFPGNHYSWGLFSYLHRDAATGQQFDVVDFWVE